MNKKENTLFEINFRSNLRETGTQIGQNRKT